MPTPGGASYFPIMCLSPPLCEFAWVEVPLALVGDNRVLRKFPWPRACGLLPLPLLGGHGTCHEYIGDGYLLSWLGVRFLDLT